MSFSDKYNKYINKLKHLGGSSDAGGSIPSIIIDGSKFEILEYIVDEAYRKFAKLRQTTNTGDVYIFSVDRSFSQGGFWRLCMNVEIKNDKGEVSHPIYKGAYDYTVQSLLKIELQLFINANINSIPLQKIIKFTCNNVYKQNQETLINDYTIKGTLPIKILDNPSRKKSLNPIFDKGITNALCGEKTLGGIETVNNIAKYLEDKPEFKVTNIEFIGDWKYTDQLFNDYLTINGKIYKYVFQNGLFLYILRYDLNVTFDGDWDESKVMYTLEERFNIQDKYIPIILTTNSNSIVYGLYESYISTGMYTCKLFEYVSQLNPSEQKKDLGFGFQLGEPNYYYVGNRYENIYPWNIYPVGYDFSVPVKQEEQEDEFAQGLQSKGVSNLSLYNNTWEENGLSDEFARGLQSEGVSNLLLSNNRLDGELKLQSVHL